MKTIVFRTLLAFVLALSVGSRLPAQEPVPVRDVAAGKGTLPGAGLSPGADAAGAPASPSRGEPAAGAGAEGPAEGGPGRQEVYEVDLGKVWNVHPAYFRKVFDGAGDTEPSGLKAKIDQNLYGTIQTKWGPADMLFGHMARFFGGSPVLLDREFAVRRSMLYD